MLWQPITIEAYGFEVTIRLTKNPVTPSVWVLPTLALWSPREKRWADKGRRVEWIEVEGFWRLGHLLFRVQGRGLRVRVTLPRKPTVLLIVGSDCKSTKPGVESLRNLQKKNRKGVWSLLGEYMEHIAPHSSGGLTIGLDAETVADNTRLWEFNSPQLLPYRHQIDSSRRASSKCEDSPAHANLWLYVQHWHDNSRAVSLSACVYIYIYMHNPSLSLHIYMQTCTYIYICMNVCTQDSTSPLVEAGCVSPPRPNRTLKAGRVTPRTMHPAGTAVPLYFAPAVCTRVWDWFPRLLGTQIHGP